MMQRRQPAAASPRASSSGMVLNFATLENGDICIRLRSLSVAYSEVL